MIEWYSYGEIRFTKKQVLWLIPILSSIGIGLWPSQHKETGYAGKSKSSHKHEAYFTKPAEVAAELESRLERCGADGLALEFWICMSAGDDPYLKQRIAKYLRCSYSQACERLELALRYCCGKDPKNKTYSRFCYITRWRKRQREARRSNRASRWRSLPDR